MTLDKFFKRLKLIVGALFKSGVSYFLILHYLDPYTPNSMIVRRICVNGLTGSWE